ncbi:MAG: ABC transporter ATP-binding protein [Thioploca sp.]|nr:ABC transporter ATP-binding protein [Thioploca sp.]
MFTVKELQKIYHFGTESIEALQNINFSVKRGEFVAIIGHSGSGKSTLLSVMGGLTRPTAGVVLIEDEDLWSKNDCGRARIRNNKVGFIFQFASLIPTLDCLGNVMLPCLFNPKGLQWANQEKAQQLLQIVGLADKIHAYPNELSGGQQRRVAIARALINNPILILADEPTGDLDEETEAEVMKLLLTNIRQHQATLIMVTHNLHLAQRADRVLQMKKGKLQ